MKSKFSKFMLVYVIVLAGLIGFLWCYLWDIVDVYQQELPDYAMEDYVNSFNEEHYNELVMENSTIAENEFEDMTEILSKNVDTSLEGKEITYKKKAGKYTNQTPVYSLLADEKEIVEVHFSENKKERGRKKWSLDKEVTEGVTLEGKEEVTISAPEDYKVYLNGKELSDEYVTGTNDELKLLDDVRKYVDDIPEVKLYTVKGLYDTPKVNAENNSGAEMEAIADGNNYSYGFQSTEEFAKTNTPWIIEMINAYALYLSNDAPFANLVPYLYPDDTVEGLKSMLSTIGVIWYTDHTGTSLSDQKVSDFKEYGKNCFSCIVEFKQTVTGIGGSGTKTVVNDNKLICIFVKYEGEWKWAAMSTLKID